MRVSTAAAAVVCAAVGCAAEKKCLAEPNRNASSLGYALSIACDPAKFDCSAIAYDNVTNTTGAKYWPNTLYAHANYAFDGFWQKNGGGDPDTCSGAKPGIPPGQAKVFDCDGACKKCGVKAGTDTNSSYNIIGYLCNGQPQILGPLCAPIGKGGAHENDTPQQRASIVMDAWFQPTVCNLGLCDFGGAGEVTSC